jgi:Domain of unknown function (DUF5618)
MPAAIAHPRTRDEYVSEARRKLANARAILRDVAIEYNTYADPKYVQTAAGIAYLGALEAISAMVNQPLERPEEPTSIDGYREAVRKLTYHPKAIMAYLNVAYDNLHIAAYYRRATSVGLVKDGLAAVKNLIDLAEEMPPGKAGH